MSDENLQKLDCNCNSCKFMVRDLDKFNKSIEKHRKWQLDYFTICKNKLIARANYHKDRFYDLEKWDSLLTEADKMKFQFDKSSVLIQYGFCSKLNKEVSFIPNTCQLDTQTCYTNRKDA